MNNKMNMMSCYEECNQVMADQTLTVDEQVDKFKAIHEKYGITEEYLRQEISKFCTLN